MEWVNLILALALPLLVGAGCINLLIGPATPGRLSIVWGNGMLLGLFITPVVMRFQDAVDLPLTFPITAIGLGLVLLAVGLAAWYQPNSHVVSARLVAPQAPLSVAGKTLLAAFVVLIVLRVLTLGMELVWRPLFAWDATMHWATKARVWFAAGSIVPFVENQQWLEMGGEGVYTDLHPDYPASIPLLQVWMSGALGRWDESLVNLPWLQCLVGLGAAFYGQARAAGTAPLAAVAFTYLLLSLPLLNTHVALAGYADIFMAACYGAAVMAFHNWSVTRHPGQGLAALLFALCCPLIKNEGLYWSLTLVPALAVVLLPARRVAVLFAVAGVILLALVLLMPPDLVVAGHSLQLLDLHYRPFALRGIAVSLWVQDNWHLFAWLVLVLCLLGLRSGRRDRHSNRGIATAMFAAVSLFLVLFLFTRYGMSAHRFTAVGRITLHLVPGLLFLCVLLWNRIAGADPAPRCQPAGAL